jgi:BlaI family transcriptional regulator, penicillinase repressor
MPVRPPARKLAELTDLQLAILDVLWERGEATVREVHERLEPSTRLARKTIGTLLHRLEKQHVLAFRTDGREYWYRPTVTREQVRAARVERLVGGLFGGDLPAMVSFAIGRGDVDAHDLARIRALLDAAEPER